MKVRNFGKISAALFAATALGAGTVALPAAASDIESSTNVAQYEGLGSCRVLNGPVDIMLFEDGFMDTNVSLPSGSQVRLVDANQSFEGELYHYIAYPAGGAGQEAFGYIPATMGMRDTSTLSNCSSMMGSTRPGSISETCDDGIIDIPAGTSLDLVSSVETDEFIVNMFDLEPVTILDANVVASDGTLYHYIIDSVGNRGYVRAVVDGMPSVRCGYSVTW